MTNSVPVDVYAGWLREGFAAWLALIPKAPIVLRVTIS